MDWDEVIDRVQRRLPIAGGPPSRLEGAAQATEQEAKEAAQQHKKPKKQHKPQNQPKLQQQQQTPQQRPQKQKPQKLIQVLKKPTASANASRMASLKWGKVEYKGAFIYSATSKEMFRIIMTPPNKATEVFVPWSGKGVPTRKDWSEVIDRVDAWKLCLE